jgi:hypothetical protein
VTITAGGAGSVSTGNNFDDAEECAPNTVTCVSFTIYHCDGTQQTVTDLRGNTREGDVITVAFNVNVPAGQTHEVTFVSYTAPGPTFDANTASQQQIYDVATGNFGPGTHTLTIHVPNCYYQVDFVCGYAIDKLGPAGSNIFYSPQQRLISADNGGTHCCTGTGTISGYKFNDTNANGVWNTGEKPLQGVVIYIDANGDGKLDNGETATVTDANGFYKFNNLAPGSYAVREVVPAGWVQSAGPSGSTVITVGSGQNVTGVNFGDYLGGTVSGCKYNDSNADGACESGECGMSGWLIFVDYNGTGQYAANDPCAVTDANGCYSITGVKAGAWQVVEVQQSGWIRTTADACVTLTGGSCASNVNIGDFHGSLVMAGDAATIGFWAGTNGQALIKSLNGGSTSKALGTWLATNFANLYGAQAGANNLAGKTNAQIAAYFVTLFNQSGSKLAAQVLSTALAVYVTDSTYAGGTYAAKYGFIVNTTGTQAASYNIGSNGAAFGVANNTTMTVWQILTATNTRAYRGILWNGNATYDNMGYVVFSGINQAGAIT